MLSVVEVGLLKFTRLKALKASARSWIRWPSFGRRKYLEIARSVLKLLKPRKIAVALTGPLAAKLPIPRNLLCGENSGLKL